MIGKGKYSRLSVKKSVFRIRIRLDPNSIWAWIRDPDLHSESGFRTQMSKNKYKKPKFTMNNSICNPLTTRN